MIIENVLSAIGYIKPFNIALLENKSLLDSLKTNIIQKTSNDISKVSMLFNAYAEPSFGSGITNHYRDSIYHRHSDSGGLQAITLGDKIDETMKNSVYDIQSKYADIGMSFDEIPIITNAKRSSASTLNDRLFDYHNLDDYIKRSCDNLINQIKYFQRVKSNCKAMYILHGNCYDTLMKWYDYSMKYIPSDLKDQIGGLALTDSAMGNGFTEDVIQAFAMQQIIPEFKKFHLLGIGSVKRLIPYIQCIKNTGIDDIHLSYDSSTLTQGVGFGRYYHDYQKHNLSRNFTNNYHKLKSLIDNQYANIKNISNYDFHKIINSNSSYYFKDNDKKKSIDRDKQSIYYNVIYSYLFISVKNFMDDVEKIYTSEKLMNKQCASYNISREYMFIKNMKTSDDLNKFIGEFSRKSKKIPTNLNSNLEGFFE